MFPVGDCNKKIELIFIIFNTMYKNYLTRLHNIVEEVLVYCTSINISGSQIHPTTSERKGLRKCLHSFCFLAHKLVHDNQIVKV